MRYFLVTCVRGHTGKKKGMEISFAIRANNLVDAIEQARKMPGVKHHRPALYGREITQEEYVLRRNKGAY